MRFALLDWVVRRRVARLCALAATAEAEAAPFRDIKAMPERPVGDALSWPVPEPYEPPRLFEQLACSAVGPAGVRCERRRGHRAWSHLHAPEVTDALDVRLIKWKNAGTAVGAA